MTAVKVVMAVLVGAWVIGGSIWVEDDLLRWIARDVRRDVRRARGLAFWTHSAVVVALLVATGLAIQIKDAGGSPA
jgi:hypothetical protein